jgi:hypothetical protein
MKNSHFRFRYTVGGGHVHIRLFAGKAENQTHGKCGDLVMSIAEFDDFRLMLEIHRPGFSFATFVEDDIEQPHECGKAHA